MSQVGRVVVIWSFIGAVCCAHPGVINLYVNPNTNQLYPFDRFDPAVMDLFPGIEISAPFPGFGVSFPANGVNVGSALELKTTLGLLYWDGTDLAPTSSALTVEAPTFDNDGSFNPSPVLEYVITGDSANLSGMIWGTYSGSNFWEADGLYLLNPLSASTGIYGLAVQIDAPDHEVSDPFLFPFIYDPNNQIDPAGTAEGIARLKQAVRADINVDGSYGCGDIDLLVDNIVSETHSPEMDFTGDLQVTGDDLAVWLEIAGRATQGNPFLAGDANLDGAVDGADFLIWNNNKFLRQPAWCAGDFDADGYVDAADFLLWNANKFTTADLPQAVPEPGFAGFLAVLVAISLPRFRAWTTLERS